MHAVQKIFWRVGQQHVDFSAHRKMRDCDAIAACRARAMQKSKAEKTFNSSTFMRCVDCVEAVRARR